MDMIAVVEVALYYLVSMAAAPLQEIPDLDQLLQIILVKVVGTSWPTWLADCIQPLIYHLRLVLVDSAEVAEPDQLPAEVAAVILAAAAPIRTIAQPLMQVAVADLGLQQMLPQ
jgi:hypothetical protein